MGTEAVMGERDERGAATRVQRKARPTPEVMGVLCPFVVATGENGVTVHAMRTGKSIELNWNEVELLRTALGTARRGS